MEPMIKPQWYVKCRDMGNEALDAAADDECRKLEIIPRQYTADWKRCSHFLLTALSEISSLYALPRT